MRTETFLTEPLPNGDEVFLHIPTGKSGIVFRENREKVFAWFENPERARSDGSELARQFLENGFDARTPRPPFDQRDDASQLYLTLMPTEQCNLRCVYCYEDFARGAMEIDVREAIVRHLTARVSSLRRLHLDWFGGEPLLAWDVICDLVPRIRSIAADAGVPFQMSMTTNGTLLTEDRLAFLVRHGCVSFQVTLDGPSWLHDRRRISRRGVGTFHAALAAIRRVRDSDPPARAVVRLNLDRENLDGMLWFVDLLASEFAGDPRVQFYARNVWKGRPEAPIEELRGEEGFEAVRAVTERIIRSGLFPYWILSHVIPHRLVCYAACRRSLVIGSDGSLYKCTVAFDLRENRIGRLREDGTLEIDASLFALWTGAGRDANGCASCFLLSACQAGSCPRKVIEKGSVQCPYEKLHASRWLELIGLFYQARAGRLSPTVSPAIQKEESHVAVPSR
ncbi:MAG: radical SAM protein [Candidatus Eisenbacteria bacterium]|nr:radical SAM protein [Candidatus Eisenbacteria bacterium]